MTPQQFMALSQPEKLAVLEPLQHLSERFEPHYTLLLFQVSGWFLEVGYHRRAGAVHFAPVSTQQRLNDYLQANQAASATVPAVTVTSRAAAVAMPAGLLQRLRQRLLTLLLRPQVVR